MSSSGWEPVTEESPCHVCGKPDWCSVSVDHNKAICRRKNNGSGNRRTDKSGQDFWFYELNGHGGPSLPEEVPPKEEERQIPEKADPQTLDRVYGALLDELPLSLSHRQDLHQRGLSEAAIKRGGYRSLPQKGREDLAHKLLYRFGAEVCGRVPGLYEKHPGCWSVAGASGMLVPVRNVEGRVVALKVRADDAGEGPKYTYLSSAKYGGSGPGSQVHVPLHAGLATETVRLTEGELKADVATALSGILTVSAPGVSSWRQALLELEALGVTKVHLAFDADAKNNEHVARALSEAYRTLDD